MQNFINFVNVVFNTLFLFYYIVFKKFSSLYF